MPHLPLLARCDHDDFRNYKLYTPEVGHSESITIATTGSYREHAPCPYTYDGYTYYGYTY